MLAAQDMFEIRPMIAGDLPALTSLFNGEGGGASPLFPASLQERLTAATLFRLLALHDGKVVGQASLMRDAEPGAARITVLVHPDYRRRGIARALLERLAQTAGEQFQLHVLLTLVEKNNGPAQKLYLAAGYKNDTLQASPGIFVLRKHLAA